MATLAPPQPLLRSLLSGFHASWQSYALIAAINTGIALVLWTDDVRPFWHPLVTVQIYGFCMAYCVNVTAPWDKPSPILRLFGACVLGAAIGVVLVILVKDYSLEYVRSRLLFFWSNFFAACIMGLLVSLIFYVKAREARAQTVLMKAEAERHLLSKQAIEAELKLMQAQVEPHFLFNTLASVQYLTETDPPRASQLLAHLIEYLRAALPQLRASSTTLGKEADLAEAYLNILNMRIGPRLAFRVDIPAELRAHPFPPNLLISIVENAIKHGIEPSADGGTIDITARRERDVLKIEVVDTGRGLTTNPGTAGQGVGLSNVRERLAALYGSRARFTLEPASPRGARAVLQLPYQATSA
jgi:sensor histidine kinase YesM